MAYINVADWTPDQVTDWLKGLDESMYGYMYSFTNNEVGGRELLNIRPYELEQLGMICIGHQEIVLEAVENLRNFHYHLKNDNLQFMALHVATASHNLHRQLAQSHSDGAKIETRFLHDITRTIATIKPLISWLERAPFRRQDQYREICRNMLRLGLELATIAQRDRFVERPVTQIRATAEKLERLANYIIQDISDPMVLQPAALNLVTLKKRESELGFNIEFSFNGTHRVTDIKYNSPAHNSGKIEDGDEIVQINYQTVVGWQHKTVLAQLREALPDVVLTVKKRPKHTKMYGQIYMQPYRLPSKKRSMAGRWGDNLPSPRAGFLTLGHDNNTFMLNPENPKNDEKVAAAASSDTDSSCSDILTPTDTKSPSKEIRLYYPKPRAMLQRRNTICGDELLNLKHTDLETPSWHERKPGGTTCDPGSPSLRDKSVSFGFGLEIAPRPTTCIGIASGSGKYHGVGGGLSEAKSIFYEAKKLQQLVAKPETQFELCSSERTDKFKPGVSKVVRFDAIMKVEDYMNKNEKYTCNVENTILETFEPIPFADEGDEDALEMLRTCNTEKANELAEALDMVTKGTETSLVEAINAPMLQNRRGRLDKSHSTPAYDNSGEESSTPPAIEPRKEYLQVTPPVPPPRPRKQKELTPPVVPPPPPKPANLIQSNFTSPAAQKVTVLESDQNEISELHTPTKTRTLTLKKKNSLVAKRRNINLKILGTGDIQGHLFRRKKDHRGVTYWGRVYFVMVDTILYGFRTKQSNNASCVIFLPGFTVSLAKEVHSKPHAFKVYHTAKTFYFAAESQDALNQWVEFLRQASLQVPASGSESSSVEINVKDLFSENDSSEEENQLLVLKNLCTPSPQGSKDITSSLASSSKSSTPTSSKADRSYLGSLRKLTMGTFKSNQPKSSSDIPVPTDQYRSYRKVPGGSFGIQIGANTPGYHGPATPPPPLPTPSESSLQRKLSRSSSRSSVVSIAESSASLGLGPPASPAPTVSTFQRQQSTESPTKNIKKVPHHFLHASIPNLVEFDFQTSKTLDYTLPKISASNALDSTHHHNTQGFVTLKDLMLRKQEEEAQEMYNNRVLLGIEKKHGQHKHTESISSKQSEPSVQPFGGGGGGEKVSKTQSRSLPKTPDYEISFKPDDEDIKRTRTKEGLKLRDFGYELISGDEPIGSVVSSLRQSSYNASICSTDYRHEMPQPSTSNCSKTRQFLKSQQFPNFLPSKGSKKQSPSNVTFSSDLSSEKRSGSMKKKGKMTLQFPKQSQSGSSHATTSALTMTLPLNKKSKSNNPLEGMVPLGGGSQIRKSQTYNHDLKEKAANRYDAQRKNSAPIPIFSKLSSLSASPSSSNASSFSGTKMSKEKRLLGSPLLHRTIFGHHTNWSTSIPLTPPVVNSEDCDQEIFTQVIFPRHRQPYTDGGGIGPRNRDSPSINSSRTSLCTPDVMAPPPPITTNVAGQGVEHTSTPNQKMSNNNSVDSKAATPDYPNMECPPVFEPEIYSLTDPNNSLTKLMRRNNSTNASGDDEK